MNLQERLRDLHKQATTERSHFYVAKCAAEAIAELDRLQARVAELEVDAERYRWLRETSKKRPEFYSGEEAWMVSHDHGNGTGSNYFGEKIDAAIDTARKAKP